MTVLVENGSQFDQKTGLYNQFTDRKIKMADRQFEAHDIVGIFQL